MGVVTIARQIASGGDSIAERVAGILDYEYVDHRLVTEIATITETTPEDVEQFDEKGEGRINHFLKQLLMPAAGATGFPLASAAYFPEFGLEFPYVLEGAANDSVTYLDRGSYQLLITTLVQDYGQTGRAVIVGRASQLVLANHPDVFHVRVTAPLEVRCERLMVSRGLDADAARKLVEQHDRWREQYLRNYHKADWNDPLLYHLTINTGKVDEENAVELIVRHVTRTSGP